MIDIHFWKADTIDMRYWRLSILSYLKNKDLEEGTKHPYNLLDYHLPPPEGRVLIPPPRVCSEFNDSSPNNG